ncbi:MAG: AAA family ATPase [Patiriisocius sp.]|uniref:AAA family ATPase n=1 Tax=Patiriisocius sp. TaxID=2822396 RepID=UPI003EF4804F
MEETLKQRPSDCLKIVLFGPESTGKTTLAKQLAAHFETQWVPEFMRAYLEKKWDDHQEKITRVDLLPIAKGQIASENELAVNAKKVLFCDTNLLEIEVYSKYYNDGFCPSEISEANKINTYDFYFLTGIDVPWEFDKLRDRPDDRENMFRIFEHHLIDYNLPYMIIKGSKHNRFERAIKQINKLLKNK